MIGKFQTNYGFKSLLMAAAVSMLFASGAAAADRTAGGQKMIFPDSAERALNDKDLSGLSKKELEIARNEIYARHGWVFKRKELDNYFKGTSWYISGDRTNPDEFNKKILIMLSDVETENIESILKAEKKLNDGGTAESAASPERPAVETAAAAGETALETGVRAKKVIVCIDPGHPSEVSPADSLQNGTTEVSVNWVISKGLSLALSEKYGIKTIMTRNEFKKTTANRARAETANKANACLMLRLHCDTGGGSGITFYRPDRQGKVKNDTGPSKSVISESEIAADKIYGVVSRKLSGDLKCNGIKGDSVTAIGSRQGALTGSIYSQVPVVTVEMVYLNNKADAEFIKSHEGQSLMIDALAEGVAEYVKCLSDK